MKTLIIENQIVANIVEGKIDFTPPETTLFVEVESDYYAEIGWGWNGAAAIDPTPPASETEPLPNYDGLIDAIRLGNDYPLVKDWYNGLLPTDRDPLQLAIGSQNLPKIAYLLGAIMPTGDTLAELIQLLADFDVPLPLIKKMG
jgi:hypothetical protein